MTTTMKMSKAEFLATRPAWAKAAITATYEVDRSDMMTDYFATSTEKVVFLAWSSHTRDLFSEMRKAAALFPETAHLGPGKDLWRASVIATSDIITNGSAIWKGSASPWHRDLYGADNYLRGATFTTEAEATAFVASAGPPHDISFSGTVASFAWTITKESVEHREKYSMGAGFYLKGSGRYSSGWTVEKTGVNNFGDYVTVIAPEAASAPTDVAAPSPVAGVTMTFNASKNGIELRFPSKPSVEVRDTLKENGWRWSGYSSCWYRRDTDAARAFADQMVNA